MSSGDKGPGTSQRVGAQLLFPRGDGAEGLRVGILQPESIPDHGPQLRRYIQVPRKQKCPDTLPRGWSRGDARDSWKACSTKCPPALDS